ncbi:MAG: hypothetical protein AAB592_03095, partial [Patescibacteria group bacterium]
TNDWSNLMVTNDFFNFTAPDGQKLIENVRASGTNTAIQAFIFEGSSLSDLVEGISGHDPLSDGSFTVFGIGTALGSTGTIRATVVYAQ